MPWTKVVPTCECGQLPHKPDCAVAPFFDSSTALTLDSADGDYHDEVPFIIVCPRGCRFGQFEHAVGYNYESISGDTENTEIPLVCPKCAWSDKQSLPAIVGFDSSEDVDDEKFTIICPSCTEEYDREDGVLDLWLENIVLKGVDEAMIRGITFYRGQTVDSFTEMSVECSSCGYQVGEEPE